MSFWRKHRWTRRTLIGLAFAVMVAPAQARPLESADLRGEAAKSRQSTAVDPSSGIPLSAGIPVPGQPIIPGEPKFGVFPEPTASPAQYTVEHGRSWYLSIDNGPVRPDDRADRFVVGDGTPATPVTVDDGFTIDWQNGLTVGIGALALALALGLAVAYMRRPRLAGL